MHQLIQQRIDNGRGYIRAALAASCDDIRRVPADEQLLRLDHVDKSDRHTDDERRRDNAFPNQLMQTDKRSRRIADGEDERAFKFGGVLHRNDCPRDTARLASLATCSSAIRQTAFPPSFASVTLLTPESAILVSVTTVAPAASAAFAFSITSGENARLSA